MNTPQDTAKSASAGTLLLSVLFNAGAHGVLSVQVFIYYLAFGKTDPLRSKIVVYGTYALETVQTIMGARSVFRVLTYEFLDPESPDKVGDLWFSFPILSGIVTFIVESFYAHRIFTLGNSLGYSRVAVIVIFILAFVEMGASFAQGVGLAHAMRFSRAFEPSTRIPFMIWNASSVLGDLLIATYMTLILTRARPGFNRTRKIIRKIVRLTIETGTFTASIAILNIIFANLPGRQPYYQVTTALLSKIYAITLLALLNSRAESTLNEERTEQSSVSGLIFLSALESGRSTTREGTHTGAPK